MLKRVRKNVPNICWRQQASRALGIVLILLSSCTKPASVERTFSMQDLLVDASVFPEGWEISSGPRFVEWDHWSSSYGFWLVGFQTDSDVPRHTAMLYVYQYHNMKIAQQVYERRTTSTEHRGEKLPDNTCGGLSAAQSLLTCKTLTMYESGYKQMNCGWSGLYDEYIVHFGTWLVPERMSLDDMQGIICAIDAHVGPYFEQPLESHSR